MDNLLLMQEKGEDLSKRFCHIEIKQCLVVDCIFTQIKTCLLYTSDAADE